MGRLWVCQCIIVFSPWPSSCQDVSYFGRRSLSLALYWGDSGYVSTGIIAFIPWLSSCQDVSSFGSSLSRL